jgi:hypothetical protein
MYTFMGSVNVSSCLFLPFANKELGISVGTLSPQVVKSLLVEKYNFLGISIVGQSNERGDGGIYIGSIMKGGAVAADGRIEPGDMLLQVSLPVLIGVVAREWGGVPALWRKIS